MVHIFSYFVVLQNWNHKTKHKAYVFIGNYNYRFDYYFNDFWVYTVGWWMYNSFLLIIRDKLIPWPPKQHVRECVRNKISSFTIRWVTVMTKYLSSVSFIWIDFAIYMHDNVSLKDICPMEPDLWFLCSFSNEFFHTIYHLIWQALLLCQGGRFLASAEPITETNGPSLKKKIHRFFIICAFALLCLLLFHFIWW